jgi:hypothetical protein
MTIHYALHAAAEKQASTQATRSDEKIFMLYAAAGYILYRFPSKWEMSGNGNGNLKRKPLYRLKNTLSTIR